MPPDIEKFPMAVPRIRITARFSSLLLFLAAQIGELQLAAIMALDWSSLRSNSNWFSPSHLKVTILPVPFCTVIGMIFDLSTSQLQASNTEVALKSEPKEPNTQSIS